MLNTLPKTVTEHTNNPFSQIKRNLETKETIFFSTKKISQLIHCVCKYHMCTTIKKKQQTPYAYAEERPDHLQYESKAGGKLFSSGSCLVPAQIARTVMKVTVTLDFTLKQRLK